MLKDNDILIVKRPAGPGIYENIEITVEKFREALIEPLLLKDNEEVEVVEKSPVSPVPDSETPPITPNPEQLEIEGNPPEQPGETQS